MPGNTVDPVEQHRGIYEQLLKVRESKTVSLKPCPMLRQQIEGLDGTLEPFRLRYYQVQGTFHMLKLRRMVLGDACGLGKCVTGDTLLETSRGLVPIQDLAPLGILEKDSFHDPAEPTRIRTRDGYAPVRRFYWGGEVETRVLTTRNGYQVEGSKPHPILVRTQNGEHFAPLGDFPEGAYVCIDRTPAVFPTEDPLIPLVEPSAPNARRYQFPKNLNPKLGRLLGYVVGEAWCNSRLTVNISQHRNVNSEAHDDIRGLLLDLFGWEGNGGSKEASRVISVSSTGIRQFLELCGIPQATSRAKTVPVSILNATRETTVQYLRGFFEGEGSPTNGGIEVSSASFELLHQTQLLLLRLGIIGSLTPKRIKGRSDTYWRLQMWGEDAQSFYEDIGFVSQRKNGTLRSSLHRHNPNKDVVPYLSPVVRQIHELLLANSHVGGANTKRRGSGIKQFGRGFGAALYEVLRGVRQPTYRFLRQLLHACAATGTQGAPVETVRRIVDQHYFYDPVRSVKPGFRSVMDLEIDDPRHEFVGNGITNHNTIETIAALSYLWSVEHDNKVIVVAPKSALRQWAAEIHRFARGVRTVVASGTLAKREAAYRVWRDAPTGPDAEKVVLIMNYHILVRDWKQGRFVPPKKDLRKGASVTPGLLDKVTAAAGDVVVVFDEASAFKNTRTQTWDVCAQLAQRAHRVYGLTATLLKNNLMEGFSIYGVVMPGVFTTKTKFMDDFCFVKMQPVGRRKIPVVLGFKNLDRFRERIDPFFLGRQKHEVSNELPTLTTREIRFPMSKTEDAKYAEALSGVLELGDGEVLDYEGSKALTSLMMCQKVVNSLDLLRYREGDLVVDFDEDLEVGKLGSKEQMFQALLSEELDGEKVIVYTRFESLVERLRYLLDKVGIRSVRITGKEGDQEREEAKKRFMDLKSDVRVIFITDAGSESINLQVAAAIVFYDAPWSYGNYVQTLGRPIRIGSPHPNVLCYHLVAERFGKPEEGVHTIDHYVLALLRKKRNVIHKVLGEAAVGALEFEKGGDNIRDLVSMLQGRDG